MRTYKIKFKNGYTVEINDSDNKSKKEIFSEATKVMRLTQRYKDSYTPNFSKNNALELHFGNNVYFDIYSIKDLIKMCKADLDSELDKLINKNKVVSPADKEEYDKIIQSYDSFIQTLYDINNYNFEDDINNLDDKLDRIRELSEVTER